MTNSKSPNFFIIGAPKCGTTALSSWLGQHPDVYITPVKEPHYYNTDLKNRQARTKREYENLFRGVNGHIAIGEASVWYLYSRVAVENILKENPEAKFIVCLRNPVEMAYSLHGQHLVSVNEDIFDFSEAWSAQEDRGLEKRVPKLCEESKLLLYGAACSLGDQVSRLYKQCDKHQLHFVLLDDVVGDPRAVYLETLRFLGVPDDGRQQFMVVNAASERRWPALARGMRRLSGLRKTLGIPRLGTGIMTWVDSLNRQKRIRPPMSPDMKITLQRYFEEDISRLEDLIERDLSSWTS